MNTSAEKIAALEYALELLEGQSSWLNTLENELARLKKPKGVWVYPFSGLDLYVPPDGAAIGSVTYDNYNGGYVANYNEYSLRFEGRANAMSWVEEHASCGDS